MVGVQVNNEQSNKLPKCVYIENIPSFEVGVCLPLMAN